MKQIPGAGMVKENMGTETSAMLPTETAIMSRHNQQKQNLTLPQNIYTIFLYILIINIIQYNFIFFK